MKLTIPNPSEQLRTWIHAARNLSVFADSILRVQLACTDNGGKPLLESDEVSV